MRVSARGTRDRRPVRGGPGERRVLAGGALLIFQHHHVLGSHTDLHGAAGFELLP